MSFHIYDWNVACDTSAHMPLSTFASTDTCAIRAFARAHHDHFKRFPDATDCDELLLYDLSPYRADVWWTAGILRVVAALAAGMPGSTLEVCLYPGSSRVQCLPALAAGVGAAVVDIHMYGPDDRCAIPLEQ